MKSSVSGKSVESTLRKHLKDNSSILKDLGQIAGFASMVAIGNPISLGVAISSIFKTGGSVISLCDGILKKFEDKDKELTPIFDHANDKFDTIYYVMCQRSYLVTIDKYYKKIKKHESKEIQVTEEIKREVDGFIIRMNDAEVHRLLTVDPVSLNIPLYNIYSDCLKKLFDYAGFDEKEAYKIVSTIKEDAKKEFSKTISADNELSNWIRNYLMIEHQVNSATEISDRLTGIEEHIEKWVTEKQENKSEKIEAWTEYREFLQKQPDSRKSMLDEQFGVREVFICPEVKYYCTGFDDIDESRDLNSILGGLLSSRIPNDELIFLCGGPGSGKSTLCKLLCDHLSRNAKFHPVYLRLRHLKDSQGVRTFIEEGLKELGLVSELKDLRSLSNVIIILDGFDEVVMANRSKLKDIFTQLENQLEMHAFKNTKFLIAGRDTLFPKGDGFPRNSHVLELKPFNKLRVEKWGKKWNNAPHSDKNGSNFVPEKFVQSDNVGVKTPLHHLVTWPLTLHLVARVHTNGYVDLTEETRIEKAYIYKYILHDTAKRQCEKHKADPGRLDTQKIRKLLRGIALKMYMDGKDILEFKEVEPILRKYDLVDNDICSGQSAETAVLTIPEFKKGEDKDGAGVFEFIHKSFSEYLVAEVISDAMEDIQHVVSNRSGEMTYNLDKKATIYKLSELLCIREISKEILDYLKSMIGSYDEFIKVYDEPAKNRNNYVRISEIPDKIERLITRLTERYSGGVLGDDLPDIIQNISNRHNELLKMNTALLLQSYYIIGLLQLIAILYARIGSERKFNLIKGFYNLDLLNAVLMLSGNTLTSILINVSLGHTVEVRYNEGKSSKDLIDHIINDKKISAVIIEDKWININGIYIREKLESISKELGDYSKNMGSILVSFEDLKIFNKENIESIKQYIVIIDDMIDLFRILKKDVIANNIVKVVYDMVDQLKSIDDAITDTNRILIKNNRHSYRRDNRASRQLSNKCTELINFFVSFDSRIKHIH